MAKNHRKLSSLLGTLILIVALVFGLCPGLGYAQDDAEGSANGSQNKDLVAGSPIDAAHLIQGQGSAESSFNDGIGVVQVAYGENLFESAYWAAVKEDGSLWMWGYNSNGQLGVGEEGPYFEPVKVMEDVEQVVLGTGSTAAIKSDGSLWMWGWNGDGQLGCGSLKDQYFPVKVMDDVKEVCFKTDDNRACAAVKTDGTLWAWGGDLSIPGPGYPNQLGTYDRLYPVKILDDVDACPLYGVALRSDGAVWAWGSMFEYLESNWDYYRDGDEWPYEMQELAPPDSSGKQYLASRIMDDVAAVYSIGYSAALIIKTDETLWVWGEPTPFWEWDRWSSSDFNALPPRKLFDDVLEVLDFDYTCLIKSDGSLWKLDNKPALGREPEKVMSDVAVNCVFGSWDGPVVRNDGTLWVWDLGPEPEMVLDGISRVYKGRNTWAAIANDGSLWMGGYIPAEDPDNPNYFTLSDEPVKVCQGSGSSASNSLSKANVFGYRSVEYTGSPITFPNLVVTLGGKTLVEGTDYTVAYSDNVEIGQASITLTGIGDYTGSKTVHFWVLEPEAPAPYSVDKDTWAFENKGRGIPLAFCENVFGTSIGYELFKCGRGNGGVCYGMCTAAISSSVNNYPAPSSFCSGPSYSHASCLFGAVEGWVSDELGYLSNIDFIRYAHLMQDTYALASEDARNRNDYYGLVSAVRAFQNGGEPIVVGVTHGDAGHALWPLRVVADRSDRIDIGVYDCNTPGEEQILSIKKNGNGSLAGWSYKGAFREEWGDDSISWMTPADDFHSVLDGIFGLHAEVDIIGGKSVIRVNTPVLYNANGSSYELGSGENYADENLLSVRTYDDSDGEDPATSSLYYAEPGDEVRFSSLVDSSDFDIGIASDTQGVDLNIKNAESVALSFDESNLTSVVVEQSEDSSFTIELFNESDSLDDSALNVVTLSGESTGGFSTEKTEEGMQVLGASSLVVSDSDGEAVFSDLDPASSYVITATNEDGEAPEITKADEQEGDVASGTWGTCEWTIDADYTLTIGPGVGADSLGPAISGNANWPYADQVKEVKTSGTVTLPGDCTCLFANFGHLTSFDATGFDSSSVESMRGMFMNCFELGALDLSGFDTANVTNMTSMFGGCDSLKAIYVGDGWSTAGVTDSVNMFSSCGAIVGGNGTVFDANNTDAAYARVDAEGAPGYLTYKAGLVPTSGWHEAGGKWYYYEADGTMATGKWQKDDSGEWCFLGSDGARYENRWAKDSKHWYFMGADGHPVKSKWMKDSKGWVYLGTNGAMAVEHHFLNLIRSHAN